MSAGTAEQAKKLTLLAWRLTSLQNAERREGFIQGFTYGDTHVIRDGLLDEVLWEGKDEAEFRARLTLFQWEARLRRLRAIAPELLEADR